MALRCPLTIATPCTYAPTFVLVKPAICEGQPRLTQAQGGGGQTFGGLSAIGVLDGSHGLDRETL